VQFSKNPLVLIIAIMIVYVAFAFYADLGKLFRTALKINYLIIPLITALMTSSILLLAFRFHVFLRALDVSNFVNLSSAILFFIRSL